MANFTIDGRMKNLPDIQRQYNFELLVPNIGDFDQDDMILRVRTATIPSRAVEVIESNFMGMKQFFPGKALFTNTLVVQYEEFEDQKVTTQLYDWQQKLFDVDPDSRTAGSGQESGKRNVTRDISLVMYGYNGKKLKKKIVFYNAFVENVGDSALGYANNESVKYDVTFRFDYWKLINA